MYKNCKGYILLTTLCLIMIFSTTFVIYSYTITSENRAYQQLISDNYNNYMSMESVSIDRYGLFGEEELNKDNHILIDNNHIKDTTSGDIYYTYHFKYNKKEYYLIRRCCKDE